MTAWTHDGLLADLAAYLRSPDRMVWTDMQLGPSGSPRPDVFTLQKSYSSPKPAAFEIKISRSDLRSDTTSGKWQSYLKYAGSVTFAVPDGLCTTADIPASCGLIVRKNEVWRYARKPTIQHVEIGRDAWMKLLIDGVNRVSRKSAEPRCRTIAVWKENEAVRKKFGAAVELAARDIVKAQASARHAETHAQDKLRTIDAQIAAYKATQMEHAQKQIAEYEAVKRELCDWLGIGQDSSVHIVRRRIGELRASCDADSRVRTAEEKLRHARSSVEHALYQLGKPEDAIGIPPAWSVIK